MRQDDFLKLIMRVRPANPIDPRVTEALNHPDVLAILERHQRASAERRERRRTGRADRSNQERNLLKSV